jgi:sec-independent protein translocase protein TatC
MDENTQSNYNENDINPNDNPTNHNSDESTTPTAENTLDNTSEMNFFAHLTELRRRIIISIIAIIGGGIVAANFVSILMSQVFLSPATTAGMQLQNLQPFGQPFIYFKVILTTGLIVAMPIIIFQLWLFIKPALFVFEKRRIALLTGLTALCFLAGVIFSYFVLIPTMLSFASSFGSEIIENRIDINEYFSFITMLLLSSGILFELPMLSYVLSKIGLINHKMLSKYRRHAIIIILIIAAILTPTPDPVSQLIFACPVFILYELSVLIARMTSRSK